MAAKCSICHHPDRDNIDKALITGTSHRAISAQYSVSLGAIQRHKTNHLINFMAQAKILREKARDKLALQKIKKEIETEAVKEVVHADSLLHQTRELLIEAQDIVKSCKDEKDYRTALQGIGRIKDIVELLMKVTGELDQKTEVNVNLNIEFSRIQQVIYTELEPYPEVRARIAQVLAEAKQ